MSSTASRAAPSMSTSTKTGSSETSNGSDATPEPQHERARLAEWQRQPRSEDPWSFGQSGKERNKVLLANLDSIMSRIDPRDMAAPTRSANHQGAAGRLNASEAGGHRSSVRAGR